MISRANRWDARRLQVEKIPPATRSPVPELGREEQGLPVAGRNLLESKIKVATRPQKDDSVNCSPHLAKLR